MSLLRKKSSVSPVGRIFLDYASATPLLSEVKKSMDKYWSKNFHNPSAIYQEGVQVKSDVAKCRKQMASFLGVASEGVVFTAGGTESNNLAILGAFETFRQTKNKKPHLIISTVEHSSVRAVAEEVVRRGGELSVLAVNEGGHVSPETLKKLLKKETFLVSVELANSEIGTVQNLSKIGRVVREYRKKYGNTYPYLHTDASQAFNYANVNIESLQADLVTLDGSKIYGPKGIGALAMRRGVRLHPLIFGGKQEGGYRAGTLNPALIVGLATAMKLAIKDRESETQRLEILREIFVKSITKELPWAIINESPKDHLPNIISISLPGQISELVLLKLDQEGVMASVGSACSYDEKTSGSQVIVALGKGDLAESTLRFSLGRFTNENEVRTAAKKFCRVSKSMVK